MNGYILFISESLRNPENKPILKIQDWENRNGLVLVKKH